MPFGESQSKIYVSIVDGMLAVRSGESDTKAVKRETKSGAVVYERRYKNLTGKLKEIGFRKNDFNGKKWEDMFLVIDDGTDLYQLSVPFPSHYSNSFLRVIKNVDLSATISFNPWTKIVNDKVKAALFLNIQGTKESVPWYYTKDDPKGLPELVQYTIPGSSDIKYSDVDRNNFFRKMIETEIAPKLRELWNHAAPAESIIPPENSHDDQEYLEPVDDLPF